MRKKKYDYSEFYKSPYKEKGLTGHRIFSDLRKKGIPRRKRKK